MAPFESSPSSKGSLCVTTAVSEVVVRVAVVDALLVLLLPLFDPELLAEEARLAWEEALEEVC